MDNRIIVVDDEVDFLESVKRGLFISGYRNVEVESQAPEAAARFERGETFDVALIDVTMPEMDGLELLDVIRKTSPDTECVMVTALNEARVAVASLKKGAYDYLLKPISKEDLIFSMERALERKRLLNIVDLGKKRKLPALQHPDAFRGIVTQSPQVRKVLVEAELHAASNIPVLITGESGTGKELLARAVHLASPRARHNFTPINMASLTGTLFDSEFFGHTRGAFTGAERERTGFLEHTNKGTLFLDEIGVLPMELQGKLLRVLQDGEFIKIGTSRPQRADIRFIAATNEDLDGLISEGRFRKDLYYRLKGAWLHLPPLRKRREDISLLISGFLAESSEGGSPPAVEEEAMAALLEYDFPGNVRELKSILQSAINLARGGGIELRHLPEHVRTLSKAQAGPKDERSTGAPGGITPLEEVEKEHILRVYDATGRNKTRAAKLLGIGLNTLRRKLDAYGEA